MAAIDDLQTREVALTAEISAGPTKPSYTVAGRTVDWPAYRRWLYEELEANLKCQQLVQPFEIRTIAL